MRTVLRAAMLALLVSAVASQAQAGDKVWNVPGVVNNGLATVFMCTNRSTASATVKVEIFKKAGTPDSMGTLNAAVDATVVFGTKLVLGWPGGVDLDLSSTTIHGGSARITAPSGVFCAAMLVDPVNNPPTSMNSLPVIKKTTQKGD